MIMPEEEMDQQWRERLKEASVPPPAFVWPEIERSLHRKKWRALLWWSSGAASLMLAGVVWYRTCLPERNPTVPAVSPVETVFERVEPSMSASTVQEEIAAVSSAQYEHQKVAHGSKRNSVAFLKEPKELLPDVVVNTGQPTEFSAIEHPLGASKSSGVSLLQPLTVLLPAPLTLNTKVLPGWPSGVIRKRKEQTGQCYDFSENRRAWLLEGYAGPLFARKVLETAGNPEQEAYRDRRLATEGPGWGFNLGGRAAYLFSEKYLLSVGLDYQQFAEVFEYADPSSIEYIIKQVLDVSTNTWKIDTIDINFGEERTRVINRFGLLDVPLSMGYEWRTGRMGLRLQGGAAANLFFWKRGAVLDPQTGAPGYFTPGKGSQSVFRLRAGLSWQAGMQWFWHIAPKTSVVVEPAFRQQLTPLNQVAYPLEQRYQNWSLRIGFSKIM